ncbi:MAG: ATP-binding protein, partial [Octadecabacter sp.]
EIHLQVSLNPAGDADAPHVIAVLSDVTEFKNLELQFVQSQKMQAIGQLAGGVAHDFNNLLTAISGHCDLLLLRHNQGDGDYGDLVQIHQNANRAAALVGQLLAYSRKQNLQPEVIDLRNTLSGSTHLLNRLVGEKVTLTLDHDPGLQPIRADKRQLEQVLMNLVVNARDAMPDGGNIRIETENTVLTEGLSRDRVTVPPGRYVVLRVQDTGTGIPEDKRGKIFEPFWTTKKTGEGTGLGLSTAYGIIKQTGGYIFADSTVGVGTTFSILIPSHDAPLDPVVAPEVIQTSMPVTGDGVVLLVEDEAPVRAFASRALRLRGFTVLEADCAEAALAMLADPDLAVDLFLTDVIMPGMDGPTWVREALQVRPNTKVVFVSGYAEEAFGEDQRNIPNSVFLPKPFSLNELTKTVHGQLH